MPCFMTVKASLLTTSIKIIIGNIAPARSEYSRYVLVSTSVITDSEAPKAQVQDCAFELSAVRIRELQIASVFLIGIICNSPLEMLTTTPFEVETIG